MSILMDVHCPSALNTPLPLVACPSIALVCFFFSVSPLILRVFCSHRGAEEDWEVLGDGVKHRRGRTQYRDAPPLRP